MGYTCDIGGVTSLGEVIDFRARLRLLCSAWCFLFFFCAFSFFLALVLVPPPPLFFVVVHLSC